MGTSDTEKTRVSLPLRARQHSGRTAVSAREGTFTYEDLLSASSRVASGLLQGRDDLRETRVTFLVPPGFDYVAVQWGIWRAGGIAVPLAVMHPPPELAYVIDDSRAEIVVGHPGLEQRLRPVVAARKVRFVSTQELLAAGEQPLPAVGRDRRAMILYTSGTTGRPKGVVTTHANIEAQVTCLVSAWAWTCDDRILLALPLHHVHGIINVVTCALWSGAVCEMMPRFDADAVWSRFIESDVTLFMAVPTIYTRLIAAWQAAPPARRRALSAACAKLRLMVSGSAALPVSVLERWKAITGHVLLERYGMTEIGMALSNPLHGPRVPGHVGAPLPSVSVRLTDENGDPVPEGTPGEIEVRGPGVFLEYWDRPEATREAFRDGWFLTGDVAVVENGNYRILGRRSVDIIKTGGYKVSALETEEVLREHPDIADCAVVGVADAEWGERVCAALVLKPGTTLTLEALRAWAKERLAVYKVPSRLVVVDDLPRNPVGKVTKPKVAQLFRNACLRADTHRQA